MYIEQHVSWIFLIFFQNKKLVPLQGLGSANKPNPNIAIQQTAIQNTGVIISILAQKY